MAAVTPAERALCMSDYWFRLTHEEKQLILKNLHPLARVQSDGVLVFWEVPLVPPPGFVEPNRAPVTPVYPGVDPPLTPEDENVDEA